MQGKKLIDRHMDAAKKLMRDQFLLSCDLKQEELRQHLKENFDSGILTPSPTTTSGKKNKRKHTVITLIVYAVYQASMTL